MTTDFWNSVANLYDKSPMTHLANDEEMNYIFKVIDSNFITKIICLGAADGCRDPLLLLYYLKNTYKKEPKKLIVNDIAEKMLEKCKDRLKEFNQIDIDYVCSPINKIHISYNNFIGIFTVYRADFINEALKLYKIEQDIIGKEFKVFPIFYIDNKIVVNETINKCFNINDINEDLFDELKNMRKDNFLAYSIITLDKKFISHYYDLEMLNLMLTNVLNKKYEKRIMNISDRKILFEISNTNGDTLITCLNNVLGNIPYDEQIESLCKIFY